MSSPLAVLEVIIDNSGVAGPIEDMLPAGVRRRQLGVRTLFLGMLLALADDRPAQLTRVHQALTALPHADQARLGVIADWETGPHQLTYRQVEHTFALITRALAKDEPDGAPARHLQAACDQLLEATIPAAHARDSVLPGAKDADEGVIGGADVAGRESPAGGVAGGALVGEVPLGVGGVPVSRR